MITRASCIIVALNIVHSRSRSITGYSFAQAGSDYGPRPVSMFNGEVQYPSSSSSGSVKNQEILKTTSLNDHIINNSESSNNNNNDNNLSSINQSDNLVLSNVNNVNQLTVSILPVPG